MKVVKRAAICLAVGCVILFSGCTGLSGITSGGINGAEPSFSPFLQDGTPQSVSTVSPSPSVKPKSSENPSPSQSTDIPQTVNYGLLRIILTPVRIYTEAYHNGENEVFFADKTGKVRLFLFGISLNSEGNIEYEDIYKENETAVYLSQGEPMSFETADNTALRYVVSNGNDFTLDLSLTLTNRCYNAERVLMTQAYGGVKENLCQIRIDAGLTAEVKNITLQSEDNIHSAGMTFDLKFVFGKI